MRDFIWNKIAGKKVLILGFGREGSSAFNLLSKYFPEFPLSVADSRTDIHLPVSTIKPQLFLGEHYLSHLHEFDLIIKTPGISSSLLQSVNPENITSQSDMFLEYYSRQIIGVTGTKGKSTTSSLIYHIVSSFNPETLLLGNIGIPPFDEIERIKNNSQIICELSSHQLEYITKGPHIAVLLNIFQEHLDHHGSFDAYSKAKFNITLKQSVDDHLVFNAESKVVNQLIGSFALDRRISKFSIGFDQGNACSYADGNVNYTDDSGQNHLFKVKGVTDLMGEHNMCNIMAAICACKLAGVPDNLIQEGIASFKPLEHRLEKVGEYCGITFYNDSIATIPEATIEAVKAIGNVDTLILGGYDRGIDYSVLIDFICRSNIHNIILLGKVGERLHDALKNDMTLSLFPVASLEIAVTIAKKVTVKPGVCLLSPAAASYDSFKNFEERGKAYKKLVRTDYDPH